MIIIPMLGRSSRFFNAGYDKPKYELPLGDETVFSSSVRSFQKYFNYQPFLFIVRSDFNAISFVSREVNRLCIKDYRIIEIDKETSGQAESVMLGIKDYDESQSILIFNIDTIRHDFDWPSKELFSDGFIEVFKADGNEWSFVKAKNNHEVLMTAEKSRISNLCSNGIYGFLFISDFKSAYNEFVSDPFNAGGETYIAPLYNYLIDKGKSVNFRLIDSGLIDHCGLPVYYEMLQKKYRIT